MPMEPVRENIWENERTLLIGVVALSVLVWLPTLWGGFVFDDHHYVGANPWLRSWSNLGALLFDHRSNAYQEMNVLLWRPLRNLHFLIDYTISGGAPWWFHAGNVAWHALATAGVFTLMRRLDVEPLTCFLAAALFAVHPAQSESVAWVKERDGLMSNALVIWSVVFAMRPGFRALAAAMIAFVAAMLSKESAVVGPGLFAAAWLAHRVRAPGDALTMKSAALRTVTLLALAILYLGVRHVQLGGTAQVSVPLGGDMPTTLWTMCGVFLRYARLVLYPTDFELNYSYIRPAPMTSPLSIAGLLVIIGLCVAAVLAWRRAPLVTMGILWIFAAAVPFANLVPMMQWMAVRFLYLPMVGVAVLAAVGLMALPLRPALQRTIIVALLVGLSLASAMRTFSWRNDVTLWADSHLANPSNKFVGLGYADALAQAGRTQEALDVLALYPEMFDSRGGTYSPRPWKTLLLAEDALSADDATIERIDAHCEQHFPTDPELLHFRAFVWARRAQPARAAALWERALLVRPHYITVLQNLATAYRELGETEKADAAAARAEFLRTNPRGAWDQAPE